MTFEQFCFEKYAENCFERSEYRVELLTGKQYFAENKYYLKKLYRQKVGKLQKEWTVNEDERIFPT